LGENEDFRIREFEPEASDQVQRLPVLQGQVQQYQVRFLLRYRKANRGNALALTTTNHIRLAIKQADNARAHKSVIFHYQDAGPPVSASSANRGRRGLGMASGASVGHSQAIRGKPSGVANEK
jgi:hypothetical protein